jgi:hypothetical protein
VNYHPPIAIGPDLDLRQGFGSPTERPEQTDKGRPVRVLGTDHRTDALREIGNKAADDAVRVVAFVEVIAAKFRLIVEQGFA